MMDGERSDRNPETAREGEPASGFPEPPGPGDRGRRPGPQEGEPHHELSNPVDEPDLTEWPDPYERREDPRGPEAVDTPADPAERDEEHGPPPGPSTSEPHPERNPDRERFEGSDAKGAHKPDR